MYYSIKTKTDKIDGVWTKWAVGLLLLLLGVAVGSGLGLMFVEWYILKGY